MSENKQENNSASYEDECVVKYGALHVIRRFFNIKGREKIYFFNFKGGYKTESYTKSKNYMPKHSPRICFNKVSNAEIRKAYAVFEENGGRLHEEEKAIILGMGEQ